jgi:cell fate regulator YaaT (PSP1 superfamily)
MKATANKDCSIKPTTPSKFAIGIRQQGQSASQQFDPQSLKLRVGEKVIVLTGFGEVLGTVASNKIIRTSPEKQPPLFKVVRKAQDKDLEWMKKKETFEQKGKIFCLEKIKELGLTMNLSRVFFFEEDKKITFFFTADGRVDFRELVRMLAAFMKSRIEMRQVGVRDEAKAIAGQGICGQDLCCSRFLDDFTPVTIRMAKDQGLALNPSKISGVCGRLMCCLQYEHEVYRELVGSMPKPGSRVQTPEGPGRVLKNIILEKQVTIALDDESFMTYDVSELEFIPDSAPPEENR